MLLHATRGSLYLGKEDCKRALDDCTLAILLGQAGPADFSNRGMAWLGQKNYQQAIADFDDALRLDPNFALAYNNRGVAYMKQGNYALAVADFQQASRLAPAVPNSYKNLAWLQATCPLPEFRDGAAAILNAQKALQQVDNREVAWFAILAAAYAEAGNFAEAVHWQTRCLEKSPPKSKEEQDIRLLSYQSGRPYRDELPSSSLQ
jgi:tetratricopeptide (TPR) repeat protein